MHGYLPAKWIVQKIHMKTVCSACNNEICLGMNGDMPMYISLSDEYRPCGIMTGAAYWRADLHGQQLSCVNSLAILGSCSSEHRNC
jgi:hypothetical protein